MAQNENLVKEVEEYIKRLGSRLKKVKFTQHAADIIWNGGTYHYSFNESIKLPEYVGKFQLFLGYPDLEDNGLNAEDIKNLKELTELYENMTDSEILEKANLYEEDLWKPAGKYIAGIDFAVLPSTVVVVMEDGRSTTLHVENDENGKRQFKLTN